jgi:hypothetical protein
MPPSLKKVKKNVYQLCCKKNCPVVTKTKNDKIRIKDDFGGTVILSFSEFELLKKAVKKLF